LTEETLVVLKPDAVQRRLVGTILARFERRGFNIKKLKLVTMSSSEAAEFYEVHKGQPFYPELMQFITSGPVVAVILEGRSAISVVRKMIGATDSVQAAPGTIRGDFGLGSRDNVIHASDSSESYSRESKIIFKS
jgi:nucleoside-diphosphate kinase